MRHNFSFFIREGTGNMFSHGFMSFAAIGITVACLLIMGTFSLVAYNANENLKDLQRENAVLAFVDENLSDEEAMALQKQLERLPNVADCTFVSREEARDTYVEQYDEDDLYSDLDPEIFRHRYVLHLKELDQMKTTVQAVEEVEGIVKIRADEDISNGFLTVRNIAGVISITLIAILLIVSVFIISNTIKLTTFDRKDEIAIMKMVGATDGFIRWPFVYEDCCWASSARWWPLSSSGCCTGPSPRASRIPIRCSCCGSFPLSRSTCRWPWPSAWWVSWWVWAAA